MLYLTDKTVNQGSNFIMLIGAPGAGKTRFAAKFLRENPSWKRISPDLIRVQLTGDYNDMSKNKEVFDTVYQTIEESLIKGENIIYDATNCNPRYRSRVLRLVKKHSNKIVGLIFSTNLHECITNVMNREEQVPIDTIEKMYISLKISKPTINEGFDVIAVI